MMKKRMLVLLCTLLLIVPVLHAQYLTGRVADKRQEPIPHVTVYISDLQQGIVTNGEGVFELAVPQGSYNLVIVCMGYQTARISWQSEPKTVGQLKTILLEEAEYQLPPVIVTAKKEDPAMTIMRRAIGMAPYYRNLVQSYTAEVYLKGNMEVTKLRGAAYLAMNKEQRAAVKELSGIQESVSEIKFTAPDKIEQTIKSEKTAANVDLKKLGMGENDIQMGLANLNIYSNRPNMPLAPTAFQNYAFKYLGDSEIDGQWVAKIQVTPRRKANDLFTGYLFIVREKWCVQALDLSLSQQYLTARAQQTYRFVSDEILLPVSYSIKGEWDGFGLGATGQFSGSIKYTDVRQNQRVTQSARQEEILDKAELRPTDMRELRKIQDQAIAAVREEERVERGERPSLEVINNFRIIRDSVKTQQDSAYWAVMRPAPLDRKELDLFQISDSIKAAPDTPEGRRQKGKEITRGVIISGYTFRPDSLWRISYSGLINPLEGGYNVVDGWVYGQALRVRRETPNNGYIQLRGRASWAFCREALMWNVLAEQRYWANQRGYWSLELSSQTRDFAGNQGVGVVNDWSSLLFRVNPSRFYDGKRIDFNHRIDITHGLVWSLGLKWEERLPLSNSNDYSWFFKNSRLFAPNIPDNNQYVNEQPAIIGENRSAVIRIGLSYTPMQRYRMREGRKIMLSSDYPTFSAEWIKGIPGVKGSESEFDFARFEIRQSRSFGYHNIFDYRAGAGKFLSSKQLYFADFHHIYTNQSGVSLNRRLNSFQLLPTYAISTPKWYVEAHVRYQTPYLALKHIPIFKNPMIREGVQASYLLQPNLKNYIEIGYSINNLLMMFDVGIFVGFEQAKYRSWGLRLAVPLERLMNAAQL
ncbi:MAG: DUF5686 and carboxypeptidase regulatory-like domain-containing protein [Bacteroidales bacterium]|nr:DUF5686 and carboxypeptidase regulatory-like domain-containing protein [Bacteroidales bacterium]